MGIVMRIIRQVDPAREDEFIARERKFDELEKKRPDFTVRSEESHLDWKTTGIKFLITDTQLIF
jgi:hypothetical protein